MKFRNAYTESDHPGVGPFEPTLTKQSFAEECDINLMIARAAKAGRLEELMRQDPVQYADYSDAPTFQEALNVVHTAQGQFNELDANIRLRFENNPAKFLEFMSDENNAPEWVKMGLATERQVEAKTSKKKSKKIVDQSGDKPPSPGVPSTQKEG